MVCWGLQKHNKVYTVASLRETDNYLKGFPNRKNPLGLLKAHSLSLWIPLLLCGPQNVYHHALLLAIHFSLNFCFMMVSLSACRKQLCIQWPKKNVYHYYGNLEKAFFFFKVLTLKEQKPFLEEIAFLSLCLWDVNILPGHLRELFRPSLIFMTGKKKKGRRRKRKEAF